VPEKRLREIGLFYKAMKNEKKPEGLSDVG
jgi:hypothetical protein